MLLLPHAVGKAMWEFDGIDKLYQNLKTKKVRVEIIHTKKSQCELLFGVRNERASSLCLCTGNSFKFTAMCGLPWLCSGQRPDAFLPEQGARAAIQGVLSLPLSEPCDAGLSEFPF